MTIKYICRISASKDIRLPYESHTVVIESEYAIPENRLRRLVIDKLPKDYVSFGNLTIQIERV